MEQNGAVADGSGGDAVDTSVADSSASADTSAADSGSGAAGAAQQAADAKLRLKWMGREEEVDDPRKLAERFSDDYEFEFPRGPGGKPFKARWPDIERNMQLSLGAQERMKQANAYRKQVDDETEWAKVDNYANLNAVLERRYGIEDPDEFMFQRAALRLQREEEMVQLQQRDPTAYHRMMHQQMREKFASKQKWEEAQRQKQAQTEQRQAQARERENVMRNELKGQGVRLSPHTLARAGWIEREARELGMELEPRQVAYELRKQLDAERLEDLDSMPPEKLLGYLGEARRAKLREAEMAATKAAQKAQRAAAPAKKPDSNGHDANGNQVRPRSITDLLRGGGR